VSTYPEPEQIWSRVQAALRRRVSGPTHRIWLEPLRVRELSDEALVIEAPVEIRNWVADRFRGLLEECTSEVLAHPVAIDIVSPGTPPAGPRRERLVPTGLDAPATEISFNPKLTFEQFVIGDCNRLAHAAALAVAEMPGQAYNPLFIYGPPGLGKTHLLHSIANYVAAHGAPMTVRYTTVESFTNEFLAALQSSSVARFKSRFRHNDVLLIDDVQFLERKARTEEEFFHTFNALRDMGGQLVITSDRLPGDLDALEDRLRERFESGLVTRVDQPDLATRLTILHKRASYDDVELEEPGALAVIAERVTANIRALEGALIRVVAFASLTRRGITADLAAEVLESLYPAHRRHRGPRTIADVQTATCEAFGLSLEELVGPQRVARVAWPRQLAMYLSRELTDQSLPSIGRAFGGRDHTTVLYACRRTSERMRKDSLTFDAVRALTERLSG
jgi:chromosomal replication initiator protein